MGKQIFLGGFVEITSLFFPAESSIIKTSQAMSRPAVFKKYKNLEAGLAAIRNARAGLADLY